MKAKRIGKATLLQGDCLEHLRAMAPASVDLVFCSPPYEDARTYGIDFKLKGQAWVDWCLPRYIECCRVCKGLVAWVVEGKTRKFQWSATPALLMADLHRAGVKLRKPPIYERDGIPGSGGPDWWKNRYESIVCASPGKLPWSNNKANGHAPLYAPGGQPSHRMANGRRVHVLHTKRRSSGNKWGGKDIMEVQGYNPPDFANAGNIIDCGAAGGGNIGSELAHENEAPFPEALVEPFVKCFCLPGGIVLDPFMGSGTTLAVALKLGRQAIGIDVRESQVELTRRRMAQIDPLFSEVQP